jgi:hypothetical protein
VALVFLVGYTVFVMKHDNQALEKIYSFDSALQSFTISVAIEDYIDIFNELDSAPFKIRDINHYLRLFLEESSSDIPSKYAVAIQFTVSREKRDLRKEEKIKSGLKTYFSNVRNSLKREIKISYQKAAFYTFASFMLLFASFALKPLVSDNIILSTLAEGVSIGGWVFLWEAISTFIFKNRDIREKYKHYKRFSAAVVSFKYLEPNVPS